MLRKTCNCMNYKWPTHSPEKRNAAECLPVKIHDDHVRLSLWFCGLRSSGVDDYSYSLQEHPHKHHAVWHTETTTIHRCTSARNVHCSFKMTLKLLFWGLLICTEAKMGDQVNHWTSIEDNCYLVSKPPNRLTVPRWLPLIPSTFARNTVPKICFWIMCMLIILYCILCPFLL